MKQQININVSVPEEILLSLREETDDFAAQMKRWAALKFYENHKLSIGQASGLADMHEEEFIRFLSQNRISIFGTVDEIAGDFQNA